jgi:hypothetical protein
MPMAAATSMLPGLKWIVISVFAGLMAGAGAGRRAQQVLLGMGAAVAPALSEATGRRITTSLLGKAPCSVLISA